MKQIIAFIIILFVLYVNHYRQKTDLMNEITIIKSENELLLKQVIRAKEILKGDSLNTLLYY